MQKSSPNNKIGAVLELIRQNKDVMSVMGQNDFVKESVKQYRAAVVHLVDSLSRISKNVYFNQLIKFNIDKAVKIELNYDTRKRIH